MGDNKPTLLPALTQEHLLHRLSYNPLTGIFVWLLAKKDVVGSVAGCVDKATGYSRIYINGKTHYAHRLAWLYVFGVWPDRLIDHKNGNGSDNRLENLRQASARMNSENLRRATSSNKSGFLGVETNRNGKFTARIQANGTRYVVGSYDTPEQAHEAYLHAKTALHEGSMLSPDTDSSPAKNKIGRPFSDRESTR